MNRRKFIACLSALPFAGMFSRLLGSPVDYWEGTRVPKTQPQPGWQYKFAYVNKDGVETPAGVVAHKIYWDGTRVRRSSVSALEFYK